MPPNAARHTEQSMLLFLGIKDHNKLKIKLATKKICKNSTSLRFLEYMECTLLTFLTNDSIAIVSVAPKTIVHRLPQFT